MSCNGIKLSGVSRSGYYLLNQANMNSCNGLKLMGQTKSIFYKDEIQVVKCDKGYLSLSKVKLN